MAASRDRALLARSSVRTAMDYGGRYFAVFRPEWLWIALLLADFRIDLNAE